MSASADGAGPYRLYRLKPVNLHDEAPSGRYVVRNRKRNRIAGEVSIDSTVSLSRLREIIASSIDNPAGKA